MCTRFEMLHAFGDADFRISNGGYLFTRETLVCHGGNSHMSLMVTFFNVLHSHLDVARVCSAWADPVSPRWLRGLGQAQAALLSTILTQSTVSTVPNACDNLKTCNCATVKAVRRIKKTSCISLTFLPHFRCASLGGESESPHLSQLGI